MDDVTIQRGFGVEHRSAAAQLYESAFGSKLAVAIPDKQARVGVIEAALDPEFGFAAVEGDKLIGLAGMQTSEGSLTSGTLTFTDVRHRLGLLGAVRAGIVATLYERRLTPGELLMDGISVHPEARGKGIGTRLLNALKDHAINNGYQQVRLDVIVTNPRARALYERHGFVATKTRRYRGLGQMLGFSASTTMILDLAD